MDFRCLSAASTVLLLAIAIRPAQATVIYNDGGTHNITTNIADNVLEEDGPGPTPTTVNLTSSGSLTGTSGGIQIYNSSLFNMNGGTINVPYGTSAIQAWDSSQVFMTAGSIIGAQNGIQANGTASVTVTGGSFTSTGGNGVQANGANTVSISGTSITGFQNGVQANSTSNINISATTIDGLGDDDGIYALASSMVKITGSTIKNAQAGVFATGSSVVNIYNTNINSGDEEAVAAYDTSTVNFYSGATATSSYTTIFSTGSAAINIFGGQHVGSFDSRSTVPFAIYGDDFTINGTPVYGLESISTSSQLLGTLLDGSPIDITLDPISFANESFLLVPEPVSLSLLGLGLVGLLVRRRPPH